MIKLNQWDAPEPNLDPPDEDEPEHYCCQCGELIRKGERYYPLNDCEDICMDCIELFSEEA